MYEEDLEKKKQLSVVEGRDHHFLKVNNIWKWILDELINMATKEWCPVNIVMHFSRIESAGIL